MDGSAVVDRAGVTGAPVAAGTAEVDDERRFGGLRRLYGSQGYGRIRTARFAVVGLGGVGSWAVEALARSGVAGLTLIDFDQVAESNVNRQVQALGSTVGQAKVTALIDRIRDIHPACEVVGVEAFVDGENWPSLLAQPVDGVIDACDQVRAKAVLAAWGLAQRGRVAMVTVGAAGGKRRPQAVEVADLSAVSHDPLLTSLRQRLRQQHGAARRGAMGVSCVFSREVVRMPEAAAEGCAVDGSLNCHGYGSAVAVTATFGMVAASLALEQVIASALGSAPAAEAPLGKL